MKKTTSKKMEKMPSPNLVGSPKTSVHWSVNSQRGQNLVLGWQLLGLWRVGGPHLSRKPPTLPLQMPLGELGAGTAWIPKPWGGRGGGASPAHR